LLLVAMDVSDGVVDATAVVVVVVAAAANGIFIATFETAVVI
jgi:hypothetical protein